MATVKSMLSKVKANSKTFYNVNKQSKEDFQKKYAYLKKHENKEVLSMWVISAEQELAKTDKYSDYVRKYKAMNILSRAI